MIKFEQCVVAAVLSLAMCAPGAQAAPEHFSANATFEVHFSPSPTTEAAIVRLIDGAQHSVHVAAYSFTSKPIALALARAEKRGLDVRVVADKSQATARYTAVTFLANQGVPVRIDSRYAIMHQKVVLVDGSAAEFGSYNYSASAKKHNSENVFVIRHAPKLASAFEANWHGLWAESKPLAPRY